MKYVILGIILIILTILTILSRSNESTNNLSITERIKVNFIGFLEDNKDTEYWINLAIIIALIILVISIFILLELYTKKR